MRDVCHSPLFFMSLIIRFISSPLPSGRLKAFFTGLWGFGSNKAKDADTHTHTHTHTQEGTAELSLVRGKCNHKGLIIQTQNTHTHGQTHTPTHWTWCPLSGRPLYCGIVRTISSWMIKQCISRPSLWWWVCVWSSGESAALSAIAFDTCVRVSEGVYFCMFVPCLCVLWCVIYVNVCVCVLRSCDEPLLIVSLS